MGGTVEITFEHKFINHAAETFNSFRRLGADEEEKNKFPTSSDDIYYSTIRTWNNEFLCYDLQQNPSRRWTRNKLSGCYIVDVFFFPSRSRNIVIAIEMPLKMVIRHEK